MEQLKVRPALSLPKNGNRTVLAMATVGSTQQTMACECVVLRSPEFLGVWSAGTDVSEHSGRKDDRWSHYMFNESDNASLPIIFSAEVWGGAAVQFFERYSIRSMRVDVAAFGARPWNYIGR